MDKYEEKGLIIEFDEAIYSEQAVKNGCYDYSNDFVFSICKEHGKIVVSIQPLDPYSKNNDELNHFINHILDHQVRIDTAKEFKTIREMIVAQAFQPCENIDEVVSQIIQHEK